MYCPDCGTYANTNFCPNCGKDLRKYRKKPASAKAQPADYSKYLRYYPDTLEAVRRLRIDTGMSSYEAMEIIERLFGKVSDRDENPPLSQRRSTAERKQTVRKTAKAVGKGVAVTAAATGLVFLSTIAKLTKRYTKSRK